MSCVSCSSLKFVAGDTLPDLAVTYQDDQGQPIDITGYSLTLFVKRTDGSVLQKEAVLTDPTQGVAVFNWAADDLIAGQQPAEIRVMDTQAKTLTLTGLKLDVQPAFSQG